MKNIAKKSQIENFDQLDEIWSNISPTWPLQNIIACNPLQGFEKYKFADALEKGLGVFRNEKLPHQLEKINQITIKWCQVFFDQGQSTITMPDKEKGFYKSWKELALFDDQLYQFQHLNGEFHAKSNAVFNQTLQENREFIKNLPDSSKLAISLVLKRLKISKKSENEFLTLTLTTLSGWSSYVKYLGEWSYEKNPQIESDYLAIRLIITAIIWPNAQKELLEFAKNNNNSKLALQKIKEITANENSYNSQFLHKISANSQFIQSDKRNFDAQLVFCIDVRSEPFRRALENCGNYETFGFAGFFGIPTAITNHLNQESYASCPVLLSPKHNIMEQPICSDKIYNRQVKGHFTISQIKKFYQSLKYNFTTPLPLAEAMGFWSGGWMFIKTVTPKGKKSIQKAFYKAFNQNITSSPEIDSIAFTDQCNYALGVLKSIGLVKNFAKIVVFCGHGSQTENNSYKTSLDCGACGGRHGDSNAKILAKILNQKSVRDFLMQNGIQIPQDTKFIAAKHNTTTDEVEIYQAENVDLDLLAQIKKDLSKAQEINNIYRAQKMKMNKASDRLLEFFSKKSHNWSETQPEWGLAQNASFIVAPRSLTKNIDLNGRSFLHSYDWQIDEDGKILDVILNAPMIVAQWINSQYLFSTIDNITFGSGSKITQNIVGKIGIMQGNASDLMHGLPLQSVYFNDSENYHEPVRLSSFIVAPSDKIDQVIAKSPKLQQLISNEWINLYCLDPKDQKTYQLKSDLVWYIK